MRARMRLRHLPTRMATGAYILNSGIGKLAADEETSAGLHQMATGTYPFLGTLKPKDFTRLLGAGEIAVGSLLLTPIVPRWLAGAGLTAFSGALLGLYARTPGMHKEGSPFPTHQGTPLAKDTWLAGIGLGLIVDDLTTRG